MFMDLDRFKNINDTLGHAAGDILLIETAKRLKECMRNSDVIARIGGDEFVIMLRKVSDQSQVAAVARKILAAVVKPLTIHDHECRITASIGISMFPTDALDEESLIKNADAAMYVAKEEGRNGFRFHFQDITSQSIERLTLEASLRGALERDELLLHYQPKQDLGNGGIMGVEALAALATSRSRPVAAQPFHSACRGDRPDRADRQMGHRNRLRAKCGLAAPGPAGVAHRGKPVASTVRRPRSAR